MGRVMSSTAGYRIKHSRKLPCIDFTSWKRGWNKAFADILFFSSHNLLKCGRVHCDSQHSRIFPTIIHVLYIAAVHWEDYKETTGKEGEFKLFAQVNEQCSWGTSFFSSLSFTSLTTSEMTLITWYWVMIEEILSDKSLPLLGLCT